MSSCLSFLMMLAAVYGQCLESLGHRVVILGWPKSSFRFFHKMLEKNPNKLSGQCNILILSFLCSSTRWSASIRAHSPQSTAWLSSGATYVGQAE